MLVAPPVVPRDLQDSPAGAHKAHEAHGLREDDYFPKARSGARCSAALGWVNGEIHG